MQKTSFEMALRGTGKLLALALLLLSGCSLMPQHHKSPYEEALKYYEGGMLLESRQKAEAVKAEDSDYKAARKLIADINSISLQIAKKHIEMGEEYERAGIYQTALNEYNTSLKYHPNAALGARVSELTEILKEGRRPEVPVQPKEEKKEERKEVKKEVKEDLAALSVMHYQKGKGFFDAKSYGKAIIELTLALKYVPAYTEARDLLLKSKIESDKSIDLHMKAGIRYFQSEEMELAIREWNIVLDLDPNNKPATDYKYRAEVILERLRAIREKQSNRQAM